MSSLQQDPASSLLVTNVDSNGVSDESIATNGVVDEQNELQEVSAILTDQIEQSLLSVTDAFLSSYPSLAENPEILINATHSALSSILQSHYNHSPHHAVSAASTSSNNNNTTTTNAPKKLVRTYIDGCFDIMHSGHYNAIRQAKALTDILVVGVHTDAEILKHKGPPVMNNEERLAAVKACKWVDEVVFDTPYDPSLSLLDRLQCDYCVHGDDMSTTADGRDAYEEVKKAGRLKIVKRTEGISTTDLVGRLLLMTKQHHIAVPPSPQLSPTSLAALPTSTTLAASTPSLRLDTGHSAIISAPGSPHTPQSLRPAARKLTHHADRPPSLSSATSTATTTTTATNSNPTDDGHHGPNVFASRGISNFLPTTWRLAQFSNNRVPSSNDKVIYIDGAFDLFHVGHIETLKRAKELGTFLYAGIHDDMTINAHKGKNYPIMNLHERCMNVLSCKYVDEVVIGAPWVCSKDLIISLGIHIVVSGSNTKFNEIERNAVLHDSEHRLDPYSQVKSMGIYQEIDTSYFLDTEDVIQRIVENRLKYEKRNEKRSAKEFNYLTTQKQFIQEI